MISVRIHGPHIRRALRIAASLGALALSTAPANATLFNYLAKIPGTNTQDSTFHGQALLFAITGDPYGFAGNSNGYTAILQDFVPANLPYFTITLTGLLVGATYDLTFDASSRVNFGGGISYSLTGNGISAAYAAPLTNANSATPYTTIDAGTFLATATTATFTFADTLLTGSSGSTGFGDINYVCTINCTPIPEPASLSLLATALAGLGALSRRKTA